MYVKKLLVDKLKTQVHAPEFLKCLQIYEKEQVNAESCVVEKSYFIFFVKLPPNSFADVLMKYFCLTSSLLMNHGRQTSKQRKLICHGL